MHVGFRKMKMNYKYYLGPSGSGKTKKIMTDMTSLALQDTSHNYLLIVPDQYTMQAQKDMVEINPNHGIMNIDVLSFGRLYHKIVEEVGSESRIILDDTGKNLLIRRVALEIADELETIGSSMDKPGFIHEIKSVISEFIQYGYSPESIYELIKKADGNGKRALKKKLADLQKLYQGFQTYKSQKFITSEETMGVLARSIGKAESLKDCVIAFDGFTGFTPIQKEVILSLLKVSRELWFSVSIDKEAINEKDVEGELFGLSKKTIESVDRIMSGAKARHLADVYLPEKDECPRFRSAELKCLERNIFRNNHTSYEEECEDIAIFYADSPREELRQVCAKISSLVRTGMYAYRDIAIVSGSLDIYAPYARELFDMYDIPVFVDSTRKLVLNPMIEYIKAGLSVVRKGFTYESVMHFLRSGVTGIDDSDIDEFDNYIVALGIKGYKAYKNDFARFPKYLRTYDGKKVSITDEAVDRLLKINATRRRILELLAPILDDATGENSAMKLSHDIYYFVVNNNIYEKIMDYAGEFEISGEKDRKKEYDQVYKAFMVLLNQVATLIGEDKLTLDEYYKILEAGISEIKIGIVPGQTDYVLMGDIERSRLKEIKILFLVGANDGSIPKNSGNGGMISDIDREYLVSNGFELAPTPREKMYTQRLYLYMNMTKPSEKLFISYSETDALGNAIKPSYLIDIVKGILKNIVATHERGENILADMASKRDMDLYLAELIRKYASGTLGEDEALFYAIYDDATKNPEVVSSLTKAAFYEYECKPLAREIVDALYGQVIVNSISRLEKYAGCAYSHFLQYGLGLSERESFDVSRMDIGNIYHEVLQRFALYVRDHGIDWATLDDEKAEAILGEIYEGVVNSYGESVFFKDARSVYEIEKMKRVLLRTVDTVAYQVRKTSFRPKHFELEFKREVDVNEFKVGLSDDEKLKIRGKIDRIDTFEDDSHVYVKVVDYKSSDRKLDLVQLYNGLSLQLVVYLDQAVKEEQKRTNQKCVVPAAMYYYPVTLPFVEGTEPQSEEQINSVIREKLRLTGLSVNDSTLVELLGGDFEKKSEVINVTRTKDGFHKNSQLIEGSDLDTVIEYANYKLADISKNIIEGNIEARPCGENACKYCPFTGVCGYDTRIKGYKENGFVAVQSGDEIQAMREAIDGVKNG